MRRVLVTGAGGFIGYHVLKALLEKNYEIHAVIHNSSEKITCNEIHWHKADLLVNEEVQSLIKKVQPTDIIHLAWYAVPDKYKGSEENLHWVQSSIELLKNFNLYGGKKFIFAGTCFEYDLDYGYLTEDLSPSKPNSLYGICKYSFESIAAEYCSKSNISFSSGRIFYLYGERENERRVIPYVITSLLKNEIVHCLDGSQVRDYMYVKDAAHAFVHILESSADGIINIGSGNAVTLKEIILQIGEKVGRTNLISFGTKKAQTYEPPVILANSSKLKMSTNWNLMCSLQEGLEKTIAFWEERLRNYEDNC